MKGLIEDMKDIFISYSSKDIVQVKTICNYLENYGFHCWVSYRDIKAGEDYPETLTKAIRGSKIFLIIISRNSIESEQVKKELTIANNMQKNGMKIFTIMLEDTLTPERLNDSFDYILAGIQACWWNQKSSRLNLVKRLSLLIKPDTNLAKPHVIKKERSVSSVLLKKSLFENENFIKRPYIIYITLLLLTMYGALMIHSGSADYCTTNYSNAFYFTARQIIFTILGMAVTLWISNFSLFPLKQYIPYMSVVSLILVALLKTGFASDATYPELPGLQFGPFTIKPEALALFCFILYIAYFSEKYGRKIGKYRYVVYTLGISVAVASIFLLLGDKPDHALFALTIGFGTTFVFSNVKNAHIAIHIGVIILIAFIITHGSENIYKWVFPEKFIEETSYIPIALFLKDTILECSFFGTGFSHQSSLDFIETGWNAHIFTQICERLGWIGAAALLLLFIILLFQILQIAKIAATLKEYFGAVMSFGIFLHITSAILLNLAVQLCLVPYSLCYLPFVSYSGSSLLIFFCEIGCILWVNKNCQKIVSSNHS